MNDPAYFSPQLKELNEDGGRRFWKEVIENIKVFDRKPHYFEPKKQAPARQKKIFKFIEYTVKNTITNHQTGSATHRLLEDMEDTINSTNWVIQIQEIH